MIEDALGIVFFVTLFAVPLLVSRFLASERAYYFAWGWVVCALWAAWGWYMAAQSQEIALPDGSMIEPSLIFVRRGGVVVFPAAVVALVALPFLLYRRIRERRSEK